MRDARTLLVDAGRIYDDPDHGLEAAARAASWRGFDGAAEWLHRAMRAVRGREPVRRANFVRLGIGKYACASLIALLALALLRDRPSLALPAALVAFYAAEARLLFVFPLALDGEERPFMASHRLVAQTLPAGAATARVMRIAVHMLFGGLLGRGFIRSWCLGCLAVLLWYEDARGTGPSVP